MRQYLSASLHLLTLSSALTGGLCLTEGTVRRQEPTSGEKPLVGEPPAEKDAAEPQLTAEQIEEMMREPPSHLAEMPALRIDSSKYEATIEQHEEIKRLVEELTQIDKPDYGMAPWMSGSQFAPVKSSRKFGGGIIMVDHGLQTSQALLRLVELGPKALPVLLDTLGDTTPSKLSMNWDGVMGIMTYGREIALNPANPREEKAKTDHPWILAPGRDLGGFDRSVKKHAVTRGDICFLVIGQIVNRNYQPTRYQPTSCMVVNSPTHDPEIAEVVRDIWQSPDPTETLYRSLMTDFHTRGGAAQYQIGAAMRLLYYFPDESRDLIIKRMDSLDVREIRGEAGWEEAWQKQMEVNGDMRPDELVEAVSFLSDPAITAAILRILQRTDDPDVFQKCLTEATAKASPEVVFNRMAEIVAIAPPAQQGPFGGEYYVLKAAAQLFPEKSRTLFDTYLKHGTLETRRAAIHALDKPSVPVPWAIDFLKPLLQDQTDTGWQYGPDYDRKPIRVCDEAAQTLTHHITGATFKMEGGTENLDRQIENIGRRIAGLPVVEDAVVTAKIDFNAVPKREPLAAFSRADTLGSIYDFSSAATIFAGYGYQANCWAYDTVTIDIPSGQQTSRVKFDEWNGAVSILRPLVGDTAVCFHNGDGGDMVTRDIRTGKELNRIATPFHEGLGRDDPMVVRGLGDIFLTGDGKTAMAFTPDASLHAIDLVNGRSSVVWKREGKPRFEGMGFHGSLVPVSGTNRMLLEFFAEDDQLLRVWDQDSKTMTEIEKVPNDAWRSAWGKYAVNHMNNHIVLWDLEARKPLDLPLPEGAMVADLICDSDQSALLVGMTDGSVWIIDLGTVTPRAKLQPPATTGRIALTLSRDDRLLFWQSDETQVNRETGERHDPKTLIAVFDVSDLLK